MKKLMFLLVLVMTIASCKKKKADPAPEPDNTTPPPALTTQASHSIYINSMGGSYVYSLFDGVYNTGNPLTLNGVSIPSLNIASRSNFSMAITATTFSNPVVWSFWTTTLTGAPIPNMPVSSDLDTAKTVTASQSFVINNQPITCDYLIYQVATVNHTVSGTSTSHTFTSSDLSVIPAAAKLVNVSVTAFNHKLSPINSKWQWEFDSRYCNLAVMHFKQ